MKIASGMSSEDAAVAGGRGAVVSASVTAWLRSVLRPRRAGTEAHPVDVEHDRVEPEGEELVDLGVQADPLS